MLAAATLTGERCRITNVPEIEDVRVMAQTLLELGVVVDHPEDNVYEIAAGDVEWQFVPLEAAAKMRASFMLLGPPSRASAGSSSATRAVTGSAGGRSTSTSTPCDRSARRSTTETATTSPRRRVGCAVRGPLPLRLGDGHRERDARGDPRRRTYRHPARSTGARGRRPDRVPPEDGRRDRAPSRTRSRSTASAGCVARSTASSPTASRRARS